MANMTFKASLLPNTDLGYSLGSTNKRWNIYGICDGYLPLSGGTMTGTIDRTYSASNQTPMLHMNGADYDNYLWQIGSGTTTNQYYGYGLKYIGTGAGVNNYLRLIADNQNGTDITAISINQNGQVGIKRDATTDYSLAVDGNIAATNTGIFVVNHNGQGARAVGTAYNAFAIHFKNSANDTIYTGYPIRYVGTDGTDQYNTCIILGSQNGTTWLGAGESSNSMPGLIEYNNENLYLSSDAGIYAYTGCSNDGSSYTHAITVTSSGSLGVPNGNVWAGTNGNTAGERQVGVQSGAGQLYLYSVASTTGNRGLYVPAHGTGAAKSVILIDTNNNATFNGNAATASKWATARTLTIGSTGKAVDGSANVSWSHAEIGATVSNAWEAGTTAGPKIKTTVNGVTGTAVAIPTATASASGAVTTGAQTWAGVKTYNGGIILSSSGVTITQKLNDTSNYGTVIQWDKATSYTETYKPQIGFHNTGNTNGAISIIPYQTSTSPWGGTQGLYIGKTAFKWENNTIIHSGNYTTYTVTKTGGGASGTWGISISGTAAKATGDQNGLNIASGYLKLSGGTMTGAILGSKTNLGSTTAANHFGQLYLGRGTADSRALNSTNPLIEFANSDRSQYAQLVYTDYNNQGGSDSFTFVSNQSDLRVYAPKVYGAVWNDYAEYRQSEETEPGRCIRETGNGDLILTTERLQKGCEIISDTFGFSIGESPTCKTPTAASGRVLAYLYEDNEVAKQHIGDPVCSGPNGTVSIMTEEEEMHYPSRIIGTISEIPNYDIWYAGADGKLEIPVNGRIWIRIR